MASNNKKTGPAHDIRGAKLEVVGILLLALSLYSAVSLFSYHSARNWGGVFGEALSWTLLRSVGYMSYALPFVLIVISVEFLLRRLFKFNLAVPISFAFFILSSSALLSCVILTKDSGGIIGDFIGGIFSNYLGATGAVIILSAIVIITVLLATGISLVQFGIKIFPPTVSAVKSTLEKVRSNMEGEAGEEPVEEEAKKETKKAEKPPEKTASPAIIAAPTAPKIHNRKEARQEEPEKELEFTAPKGNFKLPPVSLLDKVPSRGGSVDNQSLLDNSKILEKKLQDFGIEGRVLEVRPGPVVTMYEFEPAPGVKVGRITNLSDDLALAMKAMSIRIIAPIPGKSVVGIEVPNHERDLIHLREMLECPAFSKSRSRLTLALGKDIAGSPYMADLARMPHLLVAGATGTGKSVSVNAMILSILFKATPEDVRFLMVDPKMLELSAYEGIPHLITPVITDPKKAAGALRSIVLEMGKRYRLMAEKGAKNIEKYNQMLDEECAGGDEEPKRIPYIVVIIDELADLMMTSGKDVEECLVRLSQMARASGIHLMIATQRPSVDVVTGLIKTNFPARIAFQLPSRTDSRTILDAGGAETLLGQGDMLFLPPGTSKLQRIHGAYVSEPEIKRVTDFWKNQGAPQYDNVLIEEAESALVDEDADLGEEFLRRYDEAVAMASQLEMISTSYIQRRFRIGYNTAARIIEKMEKEGVVGPAQGSRPREVLLRKQHE
ncbi:MAG: DNA translocase FtsK 4TM domain-containing protein [Deltaproteobacteria bacterium]|nr:DNA translocase FtsK 4TM domain-containing protein [Deltaproteobacteria bacterium]